VAGLCSHKNLKPRNLHTCKFTQLKYPLPLGPPCSFPFPRCLSIRSQRRKSGITFVIFLSIPSSTLTRTPGFYRYKANSVSTNCLRCYASFLNSSLLKQLQPARMRSSISLAVLMAVAAPALSTTTLQPVSQISDGQIQAPPATSVASYTSSAVTVAPTSAVAASSYSISIVSPPVVSSVASVTPVVSAPVVVPSYPTGNTSVAVTIPTYTNTTLASVSVGSLTATGPAGTTTGAGAGAGSGSGTSAAASATGTGAADAAFGSPLGALSYLAVAAAGFFLA